MNQIYAIAGVSKQGHYQHKEREEHWNLLINNLSVELELIRKNHPGWGLRRYTRYSNRKESAETNLLLSE